MVYRRRPSVAVSDEGFEADEVVSYEDNDMDLDDEQDEEGGGAVLASDSDKASSRSSPPPPEPPHPRLKIKLKLPSHPSHSSAASTPNPDDSRRASRSAGSRDVDVESEDEDDYASTPSTTTGIRGRPLTARQAVLASVVDSSHVSLRTPSSALPSRVCISVSSVPSEPSKKRKQLNDAELAIRREETARKRKNLSEKKLEDEKAETINRLLKKQSRQRNKRLANVTPALDPPTPSGTGAHTPDPDGGEMVEDVGQPEPVAPKMYRWLSSVQSAQHAEGEKKSVITFSVPIDAVQDHLSGGQANVQAIPRPAASRPRCDISGCDSPRKYRMARDFERGACGMPHLKILEGYVSTAVG